MQSSEMSGRNLTEENNYFRKPYAREPQNYRGPPERDNRYYAPENESPIKIGSDMIMSKRNNFQNENLVVNNISPGHYQYRYNNPNINRNTPNQSNNINENMERKYLTPGGRNSYQEDRGHNRLSQSQDLSRTENIPHFEKPFEGPMPRSRQRPFEPNLKATCHDLDPFYRYKNTIFYGQATPDVFGYDKVDDRYRYYSPYRNDYDGSRYGSYTYNYYLNAPMRGDISEDFKFPPQYYYYPKYDTRKNMYYNL